MILVVQQKLKDGLVNTGILLIILSCFFFLLPLWVDNSDSNFGFFLINFILGISYQVILWVGKSNKQEAHQRHYTFLLLILLLISAYALNREMEVFAASPLWLQILLVLLCVNYVFSIFFQQLPPFPRHLILFLLGLGFVLFLYLTIYLLPIYFFSAVALLALGISIHAFVPAFFTWSTILLAQDLAGSAKKYWYSFIGGIAAAIVTVVIYGISWQAGVAAINRTYSKAVSEGTDALPVWMQIAQKVKVNRTTEKILKTGLVYVIPRWDDAIFWRMPDRSFGEEQKVHDPLVVLASLFSGSVYLNEQDRIAILKSQYNSRHQAEERLWSGLDLRTQHVATQVRIWPAAHLAYTEKVITVFNHKKTQWSNDQEALFTFHLPEGGVITALSLWINGREEKGILTTKEKADSAYRTIVGVEVRDPSVVHWQEGNQVTVRVFPVAAQGSRTFKIGITTPLRSDGSVLTYENIWFDGPDATAAAEDVKVSLEQPAAPAVRQASFAPEGSNTYTRSGRYRSRWTFTVKEEGLAPQAFSFGGYHYTVKPYLPQREKVALTDVYLDINSAWTKEELNKVWSSVKGKNVWVFQNERIRLNEENKDRLFKELTKKNFSLFPLFIIHEPSQSLLISKSGQPSPNLSDLEGSRFWKELKTYASRQEKVRLFHLGAQLTPYLASLKEFRCFLFERGDVQTLQHLLQTAQFAKEAENENEVVVHSAGISIVKQPGAVASHAPDHLMRLFAYNHIMQQLGQQGINGVPHNSAMVQQAQTAYVVSPVSSLVVLESQRDYERFGIEDSQQSLKNASLQSKGAVPEPHEWILIIAGAIVAIYLMFKSRL